jgi:thiol-disulfide isomerase/thioredoxin
VKKSKAWIMIFTLVATGAGGAFYTYLESGGTLQMLIAEFTPEFEDGNTDNSQSVFSFYKTPIAMPELKFLNRKKREITLEAFQGTVVLLNIWATWCVPCREEMPALDRLQAKLGGPDFEVIALSIDRGPPSIIEEFYQELGLESLKIYHDPTGGASYTLRVPGIPTTFLIDRKGRGLGYVIGPIEWDSPEIVQEIKGFITQETEEKN